VTSPAAVYVTDAGNHRIEKFTPAGKFVAAFTSAGPGEQIGTLDGIAVATKTKSVYVADSAAHRVWIVSTTGQPLGEVGDQDLSSNLTFVAIDPYSGNILVGDAGNSVVVTFDQAGRWGGTFGAGPGGFRPEGMAIDKASDQLYVLDGVGNRIVKFASADPDEGALSQFGDTGALLGQFSGSTGGLAVDSGSHVVYVADSADNRIEKFH
jgi:DNA-binding beta-propeller fold protein YncE